MSVKGNKKEERKDVKELYVGLTSVKVVAINPTRAELSVLLGSKESKEEKEEFRYLDTDKDGNRRIRLAFWLFDEVNKKYFVQSISIVDKFVVSKNGDKCQIINSTCNCTYVPFKVTAEGEMLDEANAELIPDWWLEFTDKDQKEVLGYKTWRRALVGEEDLGTFVRAWLGKIKWYDSDTEVCIDTEKLFAEDYRELRDLINSGYDSAFIVLTGVYTSATDASKKYQEVCKKAYLNNTYLSNINNGMTFSTPYAERAWKKFVDDTQGQYGFSCYHKLAPLSRYDETEDPVGSDEGKPNLQPADNEY